MCGLEILSHVLGAILIGSLLNAVRLNLHRALDPARYVNWYVVIASALGSGALGNHVKSGEPVKAGALIAIILVIATVGALLATAVDRMNWFWLPDLRRKSA
jgi:hypothetical protein